MASDDTWVFRRGVLWCADLNNVPSLSIKRDGPAEFSPISTDTLPHLYETVRVMDPVLPDALANRYRAGRQCFAGWMAGQIVNYGWLTCGPEWVGEFERELNVPPNEAYIWDCATLPTYRRQGLFSALITHIVDQLGRERLERLWIIATINAPRMNRRVTYAGFSPVLNLSYLRLYDQRILLTLPALGASSWEITAGRRLLQGRSEHSMGPLLVGNTSRPVPPDTHFDR